MYLSVYPGFMRNRFFSKCLQNVFRNKILSGQDLQMLGIYSFCVISVSMSKHNVKQ